MAVIQPDTFVSRLERLYESWKEDDLDFVQWGHVDAICVVVGRDEVLYSKSISLQVWLFGYELTDTVCVFCENEIHILASKKKIDFLKPLEPVIGKRSDLPKLHLHLRNKNDSDTENFKKILTAIKSSKSGGRIGVFTKDNFTGDFVEGWKKVLEDTNLEMTDVSAVFAYVSSVKDNNEVETIKVASNTSCHVFNKYVKREIVKIVDEEKKVKHSKLAEDIERLVNDDKQMLPADVDGDNIETCYSPIIQSGGNYQLKFSTVSNDDKLHFGTILCFLGLRYKSYCSNIVRTMFVQPSKEQEETYNFLLAVYEKVLESLKDGAQLSSVYAAAMKHIEQNKPDLLEHFTKTAGFATGIEFRESSMMIGPKCTATAKAGMVFNVTLGFNQLENPNVENDRSRVYALLIGDTVLVNKDGPATELTMRSKKKLSSIAILLGDEDDDKGPQINPEDVLHGASSKVLDHRTRTEVPAEDKRKPHQMQLTKQINEEAKRRLLESKDSNKQKKTRVVLTAYKNSTAVPREADVQNAKIFVDKRYEAILIPVDGLAIPFHVSTVKNVSKSEEGDSTYLRINFFFPGSSVGKNDGVAYPNPDGSFIKEISFRSSRQSGGMVNLTSVFQMIREMQRKFKAREAEKKELEGIVEQAALILNTSKTNSVRLKDLYMRPVLGSRRIQGSLEAHTNGLRYTTLKGDRVDILYSNIKHAFFQPSKGEMIVLIHFHLKNPIIIGKKKHRDLQLYTEVGEIMTDLGRMHNMHDRDDLLAEQAERELRMKLDNAFNSFCRKLEALPQCHSEFERPFRELGFYGVPFRSTVQMFPTTNCLISLAEYPPFIVTLDEVELVHFERVAFHLKNFDMVFVFKDYNRKVAMINSIPMSSLDSVKEWLNSCDIKYTEGIQSLNWAKIMKTIMDDPTGFFETGGWGFLEPDSDEERGSNDGDSDADSDEYNPSSDDDVDGNVSEENSDDDYSSLSEHSEESSNYDDEEEEGDSEEESGKDWSELEEEARQADRDQGAYDDEEETRNKIKKRSRPSGGGHSHSPAKKRKR
ncbi:FACT complex subunit SPT16-like [Dysidea avara]|uniref:FACT complex subunit SPT16-like n=1 Tax=Dysidea avara TaxID=196820 RepID=UPI003331CECE